MQNGDYSLLSQISIKSTGVCIYEIYVCFEHLAKQIFSDNCLIILTFIEVVSCIYVPVLKKNRLSKENVNYMNDMEYVLF